MKDPRKLLEKDIQKAILDYLQNIKHIYCWVNKTTGTWDNQLKIYRKGTTFKGVPDILGILPDGKFLGIEVKKKGNYPSPEQKEFIKNINERNGVAFVAYSVDDVIEGLKKLNNMV
jgi:hypothetical protein